MGLEPTLALIAHEGVEVDETLGDVVRFEPIAGMNESTQAQAIRLLLPTLFPNDGCLISDIDMIPVSRSYYIDGAAGSPDDAFLIYRDRAYMSHEKITPMCYVAAEGQVFASVFGVTDYDQIADKLLEWNSLGLGWNTDEIMLYKLVAEWEAQGNKVHRLGQGVGARLDRMWWRDSVTPQDMRQFIDCHCPRPYCINTGSIDCITDAIRTMWREQDEEAREAI